MSQPFLGQIIQGGWNFAPRGYHYCDGALLPIAQYTALFSLLGTYYGGNGQTTFGLPDLRGRGMVSIGQGPGLSNYTIGEMIGSETTSITVTNLPAHTHAGTVTGNGTATFKVQNIKSTSNAPDTTSAFGRSTDTASVSSPVIYYPSATPDTAILGLNLAGAVIQTSATGGSQPISNIQPILAVSIVIALQGIFPSRS